MVIIPQRDGKLYAPPKKPLDQSYGRGPFIRDPFSQCLGVTCASGAPPLLRCGLNLPGNYDMAIQIRNGKGKLSCDKEKKNAKSDFFREASNAFFAREVQGYSCEYDSMIAQRRR